MRPGLRSAFCGEKAVFILLGILSSLIVLFLYWYRPGFLVAVDLKAADAMFKARGATDAPPEVVIVAIDEKSVNALGRWPWPREKTAALIRALKPARAVALDIVFSEEESLRADSILSGAIRDAGNVVAGYFFRDDATAGPSPGALSQLEGSKNGLVMLEGGGEGQGGFIPQYAGVETNTRLIGEHASAMGAFNIIPDEDGMYRNADLVFGFDGAIFTALSLKAAAAYSGSEPILHIAPYGVDGITLGDKKIPLDEFGAFALDFYGPGGSFKTYSAADVLGGAIGPEALGDRLVFVGVTEKAVYDIRPTPTDALFPGVELHATAAGNIIEGRFLVRDARVAAFDLALVLLMPFLLSTALSRVRRTYIGLGVFLALLTLLVAGDFMLFSSYGIRAGVIYPALSLALAYLFNEAYRNAVVEKKSRYLRKAFSTYVSSQLVSEIIKDPGRLKLGGEKRVVTVLFSDIRGFTSISERLAPEELVRLLNDYLNPMTGIVMAEGGMLDKYIGDAVMAVFNAPLEIDGHPERACRSALTMIKKLEELNSGWAGAGYPRVDIGVGINTGEAVVGNMGAELRFDYTAIGDAVNLASRLEGMNKLYGTNILVSEYTQVRVKDMFLFRELDLVRVKGKEKPVVIHELMDTGSGDESCRELKRRFSSAIALFRARRFEEAGDMFKGVLEDWPGDGPSRLYAGRCDEYKDSPPPDDWDGVYAARSK